MWGEPEQADAEIVRFIHSKMTTELKTIHFRPVISLRVNNDVD